MKIFAKKNVFKKIILIVLLLLSFSFVSPEPVQASVGGELMNPICSMLIGLGDGVVNVLHKFIIRQDTSLIRVAEGINWAKVIVVAIAIVVFAIAVISGIGAIASLAEAGKILLAIRTGALLFTKVGAGALCAGILFFAADGFSDEIPLPMYTITPEKIIKNEIPLFDVNFINPSKEVTKYKNVVSTKKAAESTRTAGGKYEYINSEEIAKLNLNFEQGQSCLDELRTELKSLNITQAKSVTKDGVRYIKYTEKVGSTDPGTTYYMKQANETSEDSVVEEGEIHAISYELQNTISTWYNILRMMAIVGMMSVLVYIGIRIIISSTSSQKAKYKQLLGDWLVGMILLFTMHYIMNFSNIAVEKLSSILSSINPTQNIAVIPDSIGKNKGLVKKTLDEMNLSPKDEDGKVLYEYHENDEITEQYGDNCIEWHTDLMGLIRIKANENKNSNNDAYIGFTVMFIVMIIYTVMFAWTYIKRVIYIAFLTLISPLVALTYPIDKANDGKAQGFDYWFKEYIFNLLLQPLHLLIYTVLISSAIELCEKNWIYALVATGFIISAEKIVRTMFNFSKASTPGVFAGPAGAALTISGMKWLFGHGPKGVQGGANKQSVSSGEELSSSTGSSSTANVKGIPTGLFGNSMLSVNNEAYNENDISNVGNNNNDVSNMDDNDISNVGNNNNNVSNVDNNNGGGSNLNIVRRRQEANGRNENKRKGISLAFSNAANKYYGGQQERWKRNAENFKPIRTLGGVALGATAGTIGLAAGVASGDFSKTAQYMGVGMAGGYKLGTGITDSTIASATVEGTFDEFQRGLLGEDDYKAKKQKEEISKKARSEATINAVRKYYGGSRSEAIAKAEELLTDYGNYKIDNINDIMNMEEFRDNYSMKDDNGNYRKLKREEVAKFHEWNRKYGIAGKNGDELNKVYDQMVKSEEGITREQAIKFADWTKAYTNSLKN